MFYSFFWGVKLLLNILPFWWISHRNGLLSTPPQLTELLNYGYVQAMLTLMRGLTYGLWDAPCTQWCKVTFSDVTVCVFFLFLFSFAFHIVFLVSHRYSLASLHNILLFYHNIRPRDAKENTFGIKAHLGHYKSGAWLL